MRAGLLSEGRTAGLSASSILVAAERGALDLDLAFGEHADESFAMTAVTASELLHGIHRLPDKSRARTEVFVEGLLDRLPVIAFDLRCARVHARSWAELRREGVTIGERDLLIAATAIAHDQAVVTRDQRNFPRIPGLRVEHW